MNRYFSCFQKSKEAKKTIFTPLILIPETDLQGSLPDSKFELELIQNRVARRLSAVNGQKNQAYQNYMYCVQRQNLRKALEYKRQYSIKKEEFHKLVARLEEITNKREEQPPPLSLPPTPSIVGRRPSFKKEYPIEPSTVRK